MPPPLCRTNVEWIIVNFCDQIDNNRTFCLFGWVALLCSSRVCCFIKMKSMDRWKCVFQYALLVSYMGGVLLCLSWKRKRNQLNEATQKIFSKFSSHTK